MRDPKRIDECVAAFAELWKTVPDMRMGQLMSVVLGEYYSKTKRDPFFPEDDEFKEFLIEMSK